MDVSTTYFGVDRCAEKPNCRQEAPLVICETRTQVLAHSLSNVAGVKPLRHLDYLTQYVVEQW